MSVQTKISFGGSLCKPPDRDENGIVIPDLGEQVHDGPLQVNGVFKPGIRKRMKQRFWGHYIPPRAKRSSQFGCTTKVALRVESQIERYLTGCKHGVKKPIEKLRHRYTRAFCQWVKDADLELVYAQYPLYDEHHGIGTKADFILKDKGTGQLILVELKCGHNYMFRRGQGKMAKPLDKIVCSKLNQALVQLAWMYHIAKDVMDCVPLLVVVKDTGSGKKRSTVVETFELPKHLMKLAGEICTVVGRQ